MYIYRRGPDSRIQVPKLAMSEFLYPTWDYVNTGLLAEDDEQIWNKLVKYVTERRGTYENVARPLLLNFLKHERAKENYRSVPLYMKKSSKDKISTGMKAVAPFVVPREPNDNYGMKKQAYYNFRLRGRTFNGKVIDGEMSDNVVFEGSSITMLIGTGNYQRIVDGCKVVDLKDRNGKNPFKKDASGNIIVQRGDIDIVQNEILRPYFKFLRLVNDCFDLPLNDCHSEDRLVLLVEQLGRLFVDSKLDITGHPWRRVEMKSNEADKVPPPEPAKPTPPTPKPEKEYDLLDIDRERIALDARLWTKREHGNQFKRTDPSVYDLFEVLKIPKNFTLEEALTELVRRLQARKQLEEHAWEPSIYTFYGDKALRTREDIWESALVHCLQATEVEAYRRAIVNHTFLNPSIQRGQQPYRTADIFKSGARHDFKSSQFESFDQELAQNFATHMRANQDSSKYLMILRLPWPQTKQHLRKQAERNRYYPEAFVEARYPEVFYVNLKHEHEACHRLRKVGYALSLSREKGFPVISRRQVVAPDAFHTDYRTLPLPRIATYNRVRDYWSGHDPNLIKEYGREAKRSQSTPNVFLRPVSVHPLYPSQIKARFD